MQYNEFIKLFRIIRFNFTPLDNRILIQCYHKMEDILNSLNSHSITEIVSPTTGEVITVDDIRRTLGILDGLANNYEWESTVEVITEDDF